MNYDNFIKNKKPIFEQSGIPVKRLNENLFDFQKSIVTWACSKGRAAVFADTGLGKTRMQLAWADQAANHTGGKILIVAPLAVAQQTVNEGKRINIDVKYARNQKDAEKITITNYEMLSSFDESEFSGVVLDESSILKSQSGKTRSLIIDQFSRTQFRLSCTATPSPNDHMELGNQAEFLGVCSTQEMLAMYFTHDGGDTSKWRLKKHAESTFWEWVSSWAVCLRYPSDVGDFDDSSYVLPPVIYIDHVVESDIACDDDLFGMYATSLRDQRLVERESLHHRVEKCKQIANESDGQVLIWCNLNDEGDELEKNITDSEQVSGSDDVDKKIDRMNRFSDGQLKALITKPKIAGFGMNWQNCNTMIFCGLTHSFEQFYQSVRRCHRFGQSRQVTVHIVTDRANSSIRENIERKRMINDDMVENMINAMKGHMIKNGKTIENKRAYGTMNRGENWEMYNDDCVNRISTFDDESIDYSIFSPPFSSLYTYSDDPRDMGNTFSRTQFYEQFSYLVKELFRVIKKGRHVSFHCMNLPLSKSYDGVIGLHDFRGELIRMFVDAGFVMHSEVCIWKDPVVAMQRTKALGLLWKQIKKDSSMSRQGIPDYLVTMRKPGDNAEPISHTEQQFPVDLWQKLASPVWTDINQSRTLQYRSARDNNDERHICPLQLDVIDRGLMLWSNPGDTVLSPFAGIGSEGFECVKFDRKFIGIELKPSYFDAACNNLATAEHDRGHDIFELAING